LACRRQTSCVEDRSEEPPSPAIPGVDQLPGGSPTAGQLASDIGEGFYISQPNTNLSFSVYTNIFAGVGICVGFAGASIGLNGGVQANVNVGLNPSSSMERSSRFNRSTGEPAWIAVIGEPWNWNQPKNKGMWASATLDEILARFGGR
jgi:hypothetical protein